MTVGANQTWRCWLDEHRPGWANMSLDMVLLDRAEQHGESWLRLYQWEPHCLSFGRHEPACRSYNIDRIRDLGLDTVRRPTGGRAVWHACELTYAVAAPWQVFGSLREAYLKIHRLMGDALGALGAATSLAPRVQTPTLDSGGCFSQPVGGEVLAGGRKVVGSAQLRRGSAFLQHGSILLEGDQRLVARLRRNPGSDDGAPSVAESGVSLTAAKVADQIAQCAFQQWSGLWERVTSTQSILGAASRYYPQFQSSSWTWAR
jgi:lipoyl(octanoyl) transferase